MQRLWSAEFYHARTRYAKNTNVTRWVGEDCATYFLTTLPNLWIETASNFKTHLATVSDEASREHLATPHSSEPPIYPDSLSRLRFVLHFIFWWRRSQPNGGWPEPGPSPPAILVLASLTQAIQGLLGMGEWSMRLELTAAKMKNTGSIIKHVFT